jgi:hypothetical protein
MIPAAFDYVRAATLDEALGLLAAYGEDAKVLAGGHSLIPAMATGRRRCLPLRPSSRLRAPAEAEPWPRKTSSCP